ncbi:hypothetical protein L195_g059288, partial [Trifolium pratense]
MLRVVAEINTTLRVIDITLRVITSQWPIFSGQSFTPCVDSPHAARDQS